MSGVRQPRKSKNQNATLRRHQRAKERQASSVGRGEPLDGLLRRRRVRSETTRLLYTKQGEALAQKYGLPRKATSPAQIRQVDAALEAELVQLYLSGEEESVGRTLYYGARYHFDLDNRELRQAFASRQGFKAATVTTEQDPTTWEETLLRMRALVDGSVTIGTIQERVRAAVGIGLSFDTYGRGGDVPTATSVELRPPIAGGPGWAEGAWSITFFPSQKSEKGQMVQLSRTSKTGQQDHSVLVGCSHPARKWLNNVVGLLQSSPVDGTSLLGIDAKLYRRLFAATTAAAAVPRATPHQLRHGGASADALERLSDLEMLTRGGWRHVNSLRRYRLPAKYARRLALLTVEQRALAASTPAFFTARARAVLGRPQKRKRCT